MDSRINEILKAWDEIEDLDRKHQNKPKFDEDAIRIGLAISKRAMSQQTKVNMTPYMKNALNKYDKDVDILNVDDPTTNAEKYIYNKMYNMLETHDTEYDETLPMDDVRHHYVDNSRNLKENMRQIQPGQQKAREEMIKKFTVVSKPIGIRKKLETDPIFQSAVLSVMTMLPKVVASRNVKLVNIPFLNKKSNTSYKYFKKDTVQITPELKKAYPKCNTYGELTIQIAKEILDSGDLDKLFEYNASAGYGRNQRKGRLLIAVSRIVNLVLNTLESQEIKAYQAKSPLFVGYKDDVALKQALIEILEDCRAHDKTCANYDYETFDVSVAREWLLLLGAISIVKCHDARSKKIAKYRAALALQTYFIDGLDGTVKRFYGRIFSGFIDTNRSGGIINSIAMVYNLMLLDKNYLKEIFFKFGFPLVVMGDDNLNCHSKSLKREDLVKGMKALGFTLHPNKGEAFAFFLQNRVFKDSETGKYVMTYPWTRVVMKSLFTEESKGLGRYGWLTSTYQKLGKLIEYPPSLKKAVDIIIEFDEFKLGVDTPISVIKQGIADEDRAAAEKLNSSQFRSTAEKLYDGDPTKANLYVESSEDSVQLNYDYLEKVQTAIRNVL
jgi:hypothetical protein